MERPLVVGVDGSRSSLLAVDWAVDEAALRGLGLRLVHASPWERYEASRLAEESDESDASGEQTTAEAIVSQAVSRATERRPDVRVAADVLAEDPADGLLLAGRDATALILGQHGRGPVEQLLLGSVSLTVAARAHCPVIVVRGDREGRAGTHGRVLVGVGDSAGDADASAAAVRFAFDEAAARKAELDTVRAWHRPSHTPLEHPLLTGDPTHELQERATQLLADALDACARDHPDVPVRHFSVEGHARKVLLDRSAAADLLVVGAHHRHSHFGLQLGRVAHAVLHHAACPVAVVPQHGG
ncbi:universal stress protein [Streptomyces beihaiensis]|uniref:Universal stress protein n=1 Tax=Streptomyces beihaiensis TaxID=2984495 RepID=A0ABT3TS73_9ACTN|nr:universal stress protein [Streptomyces beihaiensis]MCX3059885.1 universal stress protein [Streptomyces beihaiensis]